MDLVKDRTPLYPGRVRLTPVSGQSNVYDMSRNDSPTQEGSKINAYMLNAIYGFDNITTSFKSDGSIEQYDSNTGGKIITKFLSNGSIEQILQDNSGNSIKKTTTFNPNGSIQEVLES